MTGTGLQTERYLDVVDLLELAEEQAEEERVAQLAREAQQIAIVGDER